MAIAKEKRLNFNTDEIEAEQLLDMFQDDEHVETEYVDLEYGQSMSTVMLFVSVLLIRV